VATEVKHVQKCDIPKCPRTSETDRIRTFRLCLVPVGGRGRLPEVDLCDEHSGDLDAALKVARKEKRAVTRATAAMDAALRDV
jgi:hypothetical protein